MPPTNATASNHSKYQSLPTRKLKVTIQPSKLQQTTFVLNSQLQIQRTSSKRRFKRIRNWKQENLLKAEMTTTSPGRRPRSSRPRARAKTLSTNCWPVWRRLAEMVSGEARRTVAMRVRHWQMWGREQLVILGPYVVRELRLSSPLWCWIPKQFDCLSLPLPLLSFILGSTRLNVTWLWRFNGDGQIGNLITLSDWLVLLPYDTVIKKSNLVLFFHGSPSKFHSPCVGQRSQPDRITILNFPLRFLSVFFFLTIYIYIFFENKLNHILLQQLDGDSIIQTLTRIFFCF